MSSFNGSVYVTRQSTTQWTVHTPSGTHPIVPPAGASTTAFTAQAISDDGGVVSGSSSRNGGPPEAWIWTEATGARWLTDALTAAGANVDTYVPNFIAMSRDGSTVTGSAKRPTDQHQLTYRAVLPR